MKQLRRTSIKRFWESKSSGFTLIELSIVLILIGVMASAIFTVGQTRVDAARVKDTSNKLKFIMKTINLYVMEFGHLPCPADITLTSSDSNFGVGQISSGACVDTIDTPTASAVGYVGAIPFVSLGLSDTFLTDGWGRKFTYIIDQDFTTNTNFANSSLTGSLDVVDGNDATLMTNGAELAAVIVMSHGSNGYGSYAGASQFGTWDDGGDSEDENNDYGTDATFAQVHPNLESDDMLEYRMRWQLGE